MKRIIPGLFLMAMAVTASAQLYVRANVGYNIPMNKDVIGQNYHSQTVDQQYTQNLENIYGSYGTGFSAHAAVGGSLSAALGYDIEVGYLFGKQYTSGYYSDYDGFAVSRQTIKTSSRSLQIAPALTFTAGTGKLMPFFRIGPVLAMTKLRAKNDVYDDSDGLYTISEEYKITGGMSLGFKGVMGAAYNIASKLQLYAELDFISLSFTAKKSTRTKQIRDGDDTLAQQTDNEIDLKDESKNNSPSPGQMRSTHSMGSLGLQVGVRLSLK